MHDEAACDSRRYSEETDMYFSICVEICRYINKENVVLGCSDELRDKDDVSF